jgi:RNA-directed DNA polymerase
VRGVEIPKPGGGKRQLGIPTVVDRLVQQAVLQVLEPLLDPSFSASSFGFRPGRGAHDALRQAREYVAGGHDIVVDLDLEKFFDRVNHDVMMSRLARRIGDKRLLPIIRRFLAAGMMQHASAPRDTRARPKAVRCRRCWPICCWTIWTRNSNAAATASAVMPTTATSMCARGQPGSG